MLPCFRPGDDVFVCARVVEVLMSDGKNFFNSNTADGAFTKQVEVRRSHAIYTSTSDGA